MEGYKTVQYKKQSEFHTFLGVIWNESMWSLLLLSIVPSVTVPNVVHKQYNPNPDSHFVRFMTLLSPYIIFDRVDSVRGKLGDAVWGGQMTVTRRSWTISATVTTFVMIPSNLTGLTVAQIIQVSAEELRTQIHRRILRPVKNNQIKNYTQRIAV